VDLLFNRALGCAEPAYLCFAFLVLFYRAQHTLRLWLAPCLSGASSAFIRAFALDL